MGVTDMLTMISKETQAADNVRSLVIAGAVAAVGAAESTQWEAVTGLAFVLTTERLISNVVEGPDTRRKADVLADVLGAMVRSGRAIRKGEDIPPALIGANDATLVADYVSQTTARELRTNVRTFLGHAGKVATDCLKNHKQAMVGILQTGSEDVGLNAFRNFVVDHIGATLALIERRYAPAREDSEPKTWSDRVKSMVSDKGLASRIAMGADAFAVSRDALSAAMLFCQHVNESDLNVLLKAVGDRALALATAREAADKAESDATASAFASNDLVQEAVNA
jgi:hypothetical protein